MNLLAGETIGSVRDHFGRSPKMTVQFDDLLALISKVIIMVIVTFGCVLEKVHATFS